MGFEMRNRGNQTMLVLGLLAALSGVAIVHVITPQFEDMFTAFGAEVPAVTWLFLNGRMLLWVLALAPAAGILVRERDKRDRRPGLVALIVGIGLGVALPILCVMSMYLPIFMLGAPVQ